MQVIILVRFLSHHHDDFSAKLLEFNKVIIEIQRLLTCVINATRVRRFYNASCIIVSWTWFDIRRQWINMTNGRITKTKKNRSIVRSYYEKKKEKKRKNHAPVFNSLLSSLKFFNSKLSHWSKWKYWRKKNDTLVFQKESRISSFYRSKVNSFFYIYIFERFYYHREMATYSE